MSEDQRKELESTIKTVISIVESQRKEIEKLREFVKHIYLTGTSSQRLNASEILRGDD